MASQHSLDTASSSQLSQLPLPLLTLVFTYLPFRCKFRSLTHLGLHFPALRAAAFQYDHLDLSIEDFVSSSMGPRNIALLAASRSLIFVGEWRTERDEIGPDFTRFFSSSLAVLEPCSALRALYLSLPGRGRHDVGLLTTKDRDTLVSALCPSAASLPHLHTLYYNVPYSRLETDWLARLPSLRRLTLSCSVDAPVLLSLFSLPLLSLDLRECHMSSLRPGEYSNAQLDSVSGTLHQLWLPKDNYNPGPVQSYMAQLLQRYVQHTQAGDHDRTAHKLEEVRKHDSAFAMPSCPGCTWRLEYLHIPSFTEEVAQLVTILRSITSLHISSSSRTDHIHSFFSVASPARFPNMRRISMPVTDPAFFASFASQLQHVTLMGLSSYSPSCELLFASVLNCTKLVSLRLVNDSPVQQAISLPAVISPIPLLQKLHIHAPAYSSGRPTHLQHADMVRLIEACPHATRPVRHPSQCVCHPAASYIALVSTTLRTHHPQ